MKMLVEVEVPDIRSMVLALDLVKGFVKVLVLVLEMDLVKDFSLDLVKDFSLVFALELVKDL